MPDIVIEEGFSSCHERWIKGKTLFPADPSTVCRTCVIHEIVNNFAHQSVSVTQLWCIGARKPKV